MSRQLVRDTRPELDLRRELHRRGWRYRVDLKLFSGLQRRADLAFTRSKVAVFVDGCFWHGCSTHRTIPKSNDDWWRDKIEQNRRRDADTDERLRAAQWTVIRIWEHVPVADAVEMVEAALARAGAGRK